MQLVIHCADVGSIKEGKFGWARMAVDESGGICSRGREIGDFADGIANDLNDGYRVAVGFECPLFVPVPDDPAELTAGRPGEGNRSWSAVGGACSLATGLSETVWILDHARRRTRGSPRVSARWAAFRDGVPGLFVWEAFVTKSSKSDGHDRDAELAVRAFNRALPEPEEQNAIPCNGRVRSLIGAALLQTGWAKDLSWLHDPCIVVRVDGSHRKAK